MLLLGRKRGSRERVEGGRGWWAPSKGGAPLNCMADGGNEAARHGESEGASTWETLTYIYILVARIGSHL